jgi:hypothetical protein
MKLPQLVHMGNNYKHIFEEEIVLRLIGKNNNNDRCTPLPSEAGLIDLLQGEIYNLYGNMSHNKGSATV